MLAEILLLYLLARKLQIGFGRLFYKFTKSERLSGYLLAVLFLPGTFIHEIAHFLTALFLLVPVGQIELMPEVVGERSVKLGSVPIGKADPVRRFLIGVAPLVFGLLTIILTIYILSMYRYIDTWWQILLVGYFIFTIGNTMFLSRKDLEGAWKLLVLVVIAFITLYFIGLRINLEQLAQLLLAGRSLGEGWSNEVLEIIKKANIFLAIPVIIDIVFVTVFKVVKIL